MMFPWMLDELSLFSDKGHGGEGNGKLCELGHALAKRKWDKLYDVEVLKDAGKVGHVKIAAITYVEDMFVDYDLAQETAALIGSEKTTFEKSGLEKSEFA